MKKEFESIQALKVDLANGKDGTVAILHNPGNAKVFVSVEKHEDIEKYGVQFLYREVGPLRLVESVPHHDVKEVTLPVLVDETLEGESCYLEVAE